MTWAEKTVDSAQKEIRPWGWYEVLLETPACKVKRLYVAPGHRLSDQRHKFREERWVVVKGVARVTLDGVSKDYQYGDVIVISLGMWHRLACPADSDGVEIIETQVGMSFGEDDIERRADDYNRK